MDEKTSERIHAIAKSLKELHLAVDMEEALRRAREIVESAKTDGKSIRELMNEISDEAKEETKTAEHIEKESERSREELSSEAREEHRQIEQNLESGKGTKTAVKSAEEQLDFDVKVHKLEKGDVKEAMREVDELECATKDAEFIVKEAEKVQKPKKK